MGPMRHKMGVWMMRKKSRRGMEGSGCIEKTVIV